jgi:hypothetical protein
MSAPVSSAGGDTMAMTPALPPIGPSSEEVGTQIPTTALTAAQAAAFDA